MPLFSEDIKKMINERLLTEEPEDEPVDDAADEDLEDDDLFSDEDLDAAADDGDAEGDEDLDGEEDPDADLDVEPAEDYASDEEKLEELFTDTGTPEHDYSLSNESNIRLFSFKFKNSGIEPFDTMSEMEKKEGIRSDEVEARLTPDQYEVYLEKNKELRTKYDKLGVREKNVIVYNSNIPMMYNNDSGISTAISHPKDENQAIQKVVEYMDRVFEGHWVDKKNAVTFLQNIKINFSEEKKIRPNLISMKFFEEFEDREVIPFNRISIELPSSVQSFIRKYQEEEEYKKSSIFRTLVDDYVGSGVGSSKSSVYPVLKEDSGEDLDSEDGLEGDSEESEDDLGGLGGSGGDLAAEEGGDAGLEDDFEGDDADAGEEEI